MIYFSIVFFCMAGLFLTLLEDRFRVWTTIGAVGGGYVLSLILAFLLRRLTDQPVLAQQLPCFAGAAVFFGLSLFFFTNNILQKLFLALLSLCNFTFLSFFIPLLLGLMPFSTAGAFAGVFSVVVTVLFTLLLGLCLYRPIRHYSDRGASGFLVGMCLLLLCLYLLSLGLFDFLFRTNIPAARLLTAALLYGAMIFAFRSIYQAGRFREKTAAAAARNSILAMETEALTDLLAGVREAQSAQKAGEYALDTIAVLLSDGVSEKIPAYIASVKQNSLHTPVLEKYHENPYLNAVIAVKAAFAAQNGITFECNAVTDEAPLKTAELCILINELLSKACREAACFEGERKLRFTAFPARDALTLEVVYSSLLPEPEKFTLQGKKAADIARWLFEEPSQEMGSPQGLENTEEILGRYSGKLTVSGAPNETILQVCLHF